MLHETISELLVASPLNFYQWTMPTACPIDINEHRDNYFKNIYLKENLRNAINENNKMDIYYWIIQTWGGISSFIRGDRNDRRINNFLEEIGNNQLSRNSFDRISSLSKVASFINPEEYVIYDSRAIYSLNWLLFIHTDDHLFLQPPTRNARLDRFCMQTIFELCGNVEPPPYRAYKTSYHEYCKLLKDLAHNISPDGLIKPYHIEMLLFQIAPTNIIDDIRARTSLTIQR